MRHRFPIFRTSDPDCFRDTAANLFGVTRASLSRPDGFEVWARFAPLNDIVLASGGSTNQFTFVYPEADFARIQFAKSGRGTSAVGDLIDIVDDGLACVVSPGQAARMDYGDGHERLTVRLATKAIQKKLSALTGLHSHGRLEFGARVHLNAPRGRGLADLVWFIETQLDSTLMSPAALIELEQAVITAFLFATEHEYSGRLEQDARDAAPRQVRMAEEFIAANWNKPIVIEDLVAITNVSARSLFRSFRLARGYSPMAFVKMVRLKRAQEMLSSGNPVTSVTGVAMYCGFPSVGHFANDYHRLFGEFPFRTLARAQG